jgi:hypothetical protein
MNRSLQKPYSEGNSIAITQCSSKTGKCKLYDISGGIFGGSGVHPLIGESTAEVLTNDMQRFASEPPGLDAHHHAGLIGIGVWGAVERLCKVQHNSSIAP